MEGKLNEIYQEFAETIGEDESDESVLNRSEEWFFARVSQETDDVEAIGSMARQLSNCIAQAVQMNKIFKEEKEMSKVWMVSGSICRQVDSDFQIESSLPVGIYNVQLSKQGWFLEKYANKFVFPYKMYGLQNEFISHVLKTYEATTGNLGIMLTGTKGTGKTVTAKELANKLGLPVIIVKDMGDYNQALIEFLSSLSCDCVLFLDEFEKNFKEEDSTILQIMDGVYNSSYRRVFLLTTNNLTVNDNLMSRPSRIRYTKHFGNLEFSTVNEYLDDALINKDAKQELIDYIDSLQVSTIDILKTVVNEVNIHGIEGLRRAKGFFNVVTNTYDYSCLRGYAYENEVMQNKDAFSMDNFMKAVERFNNPMSKPIVADEDNCSIEERKALNEYYDYRRHVFHSIGYNYVSSNVKFQNLQIGDSFYGDDIIAIDKKLGIVVTKDGGEINFYWLKDPNCKPSIYSKAARSDWAF